MTKYEYYGLIVLMGKGQWFYSNLVNNVQNLPEAQALYLLYLSILVLLLSTSYNRDNIKPKYLPKP